MNQRPEVICVGAMLWDVLGRTDQRMTPGADLPGHIRHRPGGVALNVAIALAHWGIKPAILSLVGQDVEGAALILAAEKLGVMTAWLTRDPSLATDCYMAIEDQSGLIAAAADLHSLEAAGERILSPLFTGLATWSGPLVMDGNLKADLYAQITGAPALAATDLRVVLASPDKADRVAPLLKSRRCCFYLNRLEAEMLVNNSFTDAAQAAKAIVREGAARAIVTDGPNFVADCVEGGDLLTCTPPTIAIHRVTGAGDSFVAAHIAAELRHLPREVALQQAVTAAADQVSRKDTA